MKFITYAAIFISFALSAQQLVVNPDFSQLDKKGKPIGWKCDESIIIIPDEDGQNKAVIINARNAGLSQVLELKPEYAHLELDFWMKTTNVVQGEENWHTARLAMAFQDKDGNRVGAWPNVFGWCGTSQWQHCIRRYIIPKGATKLSFSASLFAKSGMAEFKNIRFTVKAYRLDKPANAPCPMHEEAAQSIEDAWRRTTPTRETVSMNGLWQFRPALSEDDAARIPDDNDCWGWFKLPAIWPAKWSAIEAYQTPILAQFLEDNLITNENDEPKSAWYKRTFTVPKDWDDRQSVLEFSLVNTHLKAFVDGQPAGELWFPGGELDMTGKLLPGKRHTLALLVNAVPLATNSKSFMAPDRIIEQKATVKNKGINGDVFLTARPKSDRIAFVQAIPSVRQKSITFKAEFENIVRASFHIVADVILPDGSVKTFRTKLPIAPDEHNTIFFTSPWINPPLWDLHSPQLLEASVSIYAADGVTLIDRMIPFTFGFREFYAQGKDLYLNGSPIHLRAMHCDAGSSITNECSAEPQATEMMDRMKLYGFNFLINGHYNFSFGSMNYLEGLLNAGAKNGFLMSFSLPHLKDFNWNLHAPAVRDRYEQITQFLIRKVTNNPAVVMYAINHNACGYAGDQNPLKIDGLYHPEKDVESDKPIEGNRRNQATHAEKIIKSLDSTRLVYHHESGNLGDLHSVNIYLNWAPLQERSEWMKHWAAKGVKPAFFVEWGLPHISSWSSYRGPAFIWRTEAFQSIWGTEFAAAEIGEEAYSQAAKYGHDVIEHEQKLWETGKPFAWSSLNSPIRKYPFYHQIMAKYATDNWRSHRTFGVPAMLPWDQGEFWQSPENAPRPVILNDLSVLKQPGIFPDRLTAIPGQFIYGKTDPAAWRPTPLGEAFLRWNKETCAYIAGPADNFTDKTHAYKQSENIRKTIVLINDSRETRTVKGTWRCQSLIKSFSTKIKPGMIQFVPIDCSVIDSGLLNHTFDSRIVIKAEFDNGDIWTDQFEFQVLPEQDNILNGQSVQIYDPKGLTTQYLQSISMLQLVPLTADAAPDFNKTIVIGREALDDPTQITWLPGAIFKGKVLFFEQSYDALTKRLGFRANIHGLRELYVTKFIHPAFKDCLTTIDEDEQNAANDALKNWRGSSTLTPPFLELPEHEQHSPQWNWLGFNNTRVWTAGNHGNVASVLIEKPSVGNWRPLAVGGFDLQYAPLMELIVGEGRTIFCQLDVTARTENDPIADRIVCRLIDYLYSTPKPPIKRKVYYVGGPEGRKLLQDLKIDFEDYEDQPLRNDILLCAHGAPLEMLQHIKLNARKPIKLLERLELKDKKPAGLIALGLNREELETAGFKAADEPLQFAVPFPLENHPQVLEPAKKNLKASQDYVKDMPDKEIAETAMEIIRGMTSADLYWHAKLDKTAIQFPDKYENDKYNLYLPSFTATIYDSRVVVCIQVAPWDFDTATKPYLRTSYRRSVFTVAKILTNLGADVNNPIMQILSNPPPDKAWLRSYYLQTPEATDDPYRYYRW
ncbi:MAG: hypothetical protein J6X49_05590 [Victivallales bacterium]|nr:hypothetical protein [Victivallales bacterium]